MTQGATRSAARPGRVLPMMTGSFDTMAGLLLPEEPQQADATQIRADSGDLASPDAGDFAGHNWCSAVAQLGLTDGRWSVSAKFDQIEPERFYLRENPVHR